MLKLQACIKYCEQDNSAAKVSIYLFLFINSNIKLVCVSCLQLIAGMTEKSLTSSCLYTVVAGAAPSR